MNCIIIEDEINSRLLLQQMLAKFFPDVKLLGVGGSVTEGIALLSNLNPDVVLLDIEITEGTGFDILDQLKDKNIKVIFITGYEHYALKAIKYSALDYILKPVALEELRNALAKVSEAESENSKIEVFKENIVNTSGPDQIMVPQNKGYKVIPVDSIYYLEASGPYVYIHFEDGQKILASHTLGYYEELLEDNLFFRTHKSYVVNLAKIVRIITQPTLHLQLNNDALVDLAVRRKEAFMDVFSRLSPR
jgi:two-component system LytT family response regulator